MPSLAASSSERTAFFRSITILGAALVCSGYYGVRQLLLYAPGDAEQIQIQIALLAGALAATIVFAKGRGAPHPRLTSVCLIVLSVTLSAAPAGLFSLHTSSNGGVPLMLSLALVLALSSGSCLLLAWLPLAQAAVKVGYLTWLINPFRLLGACVAGAVGIGLLTRLGQYRIGIGLGVICALCVPLLVSAWAHVERRSIRSTGLARRTAYAVALLAALAFAHSTKRIHVAEVDAFLDEIVYAADTDAGRVVVTHSPSGFDLFIDGVVRVSSLDQHRYYEALTRPVLQRSNDAPRVLLLFGDTRFSVQSLLNAGPVASLDVVAQDRDLFELSGRAAWMRHLFEPSTQSDERVRVIEAEPLPWLMQNTERYDVIIADLPPPLDYVAGKYYTRFFFSLLSQHLAPRGIATLPTTSASESPASFCSIVSSLEAAGLATQHYAVGLPTVGEWWFALATPAPTLPPPRNAPTSTHARYLDRATLTASFGVQHDCTPRRELVASLDAQYPVEQFSEAHAAKSANY